MLDLSDCLAKRDIKPERTLVMRHRPTSKSLREALSWWAGERPAWYNDYQRSQKPRQERMLSSASYLVSCIGHEPGLALFIGIYRVCGFRPISEEEFWAIPANKEMRALDSTATATVWFDLEPLEEMIDWRGRLCLIWPKPERAWARWGKQNMFPIAAIHPERILIRPMPSWRDVSIDWTQLRNLPQSWVNNLKAWRGIYLIHDRSDGKSYVGSAYGADNIYGRWLGYAVSGDGGNKLLKERDPATFLFSVLERVGPDSAPEDVVALETSWKTRLHTYSSYGGLNAN